VVCSTVTLLNTHCATAVTAVSGRDQAAQRLESSWEGMRRDVCVVV
jgi:hypothetical protein